MNLNKIMLLYVVAAMTLSAKLDATETKSLSQAILQRVAAEAGKSTFRHGLTGDERAYIHKLFEEIGSLCAFVSEYTNKFVDAKDKTPYRDYVKALKNMLERIEKVTKELDTKKIQAQQQGSSNFSEGIALAQVMVHDFLERLNKMCVVLTKYVNVRNDPKKALELGKEIKPHVKDLIDTKRLSDIEMLVSRIYALMEDAQENELADILFEILETIRRMNKGGATRSISDVAVLNALTTKLRYN